MLNWRISPIHSPKYYQNPEREIIKFRQTINFYYKILFILWKYWLLNSHNSKLVAGGYLFWEWKLQLLISQCANWFDIWWSKKLNREPVCSFLKDFCNLLEGVMTSKHTSFWEELKSGEISYKRLQNANFQHLHRRRKIRKTDDLFWIHYTILTLCRYVLACCKPWCK